MRTPLRQFEFIRCSPRPTRPALLLLGAIATMLASACASLPPVVASDGGSANDSTAAPQRKLHAPPQCYGYVLLVENGHSQPVEIYEVGNASPRFVAVALIGLTEVPMTDRSQQFIAMSSRGEFMAASASNETRPSDKVALQRSCRTYQ